MIPAFRLKRDAIAGLVSWIVPLAANFVATPIVVRSLGATDYGIFALLGSLGAYAVAFATSNALVRFSPRLGGSPLAGYRALLPTAIGLGVVSAAANCLAICMFWDWFFPVGDNNANTGFLVTCALVLVLIINQILMAGPQIARRLPWLALANMVAGIAVPVGAALIAVSGGGWSQVLGWQLCVATALGLLFALMNRRLFGLLGGDMATSKTARRGFLLFAATIGVAQMLGNALAISERGLLGALAGPQAVGHYALAMMIALLLRTAVAQATLMLIVVVAQSNDEAAMDRLKRMYGWLVRNVLAFVVYAAVALVLVAETLLKLWLKDGYSHETAAALRWLAPTIALMALVIVPWNFAEGRGFVTANIAMAGSLLVGCLALGALLVPERGAEGLAIARLASLAMLPIYIAWIERRIFNAVQVSLWIGCLWRVGLAGLVAAVALQAGLALLPSGWIALGSSLLFGLVIFYLVLIGTRHLRRQDLTVPGVAISGESAS